MIGPKHAMSFVLPATASPSQSWSGRMFEAATKSRK